MTCVIAYKDSSNHVWMASDRCIAQIKRDFNGKKIGTEINEYASVIKSSIKNGVLIGAAGSLYIWERIQELDFNKPYLKSGSYNHYVSNVFMKNIVFCVEKVKKIFSEQKGINIYLIFAIGSQVYYCDINYDLNINIKHKLRDWKKKKYYNFYKLIYLNKNCVTYEFKNAVPGMSVLIGSADFNTFNNSANKYRLTDNLNDDILIEQRMISTCKDIAETVFGCNKDIDVINNNPLSW